MTQTQQILNHLKSGKTITPLEALDLYGCFRCAARIHELKRDGHPIESRLVSKGDKKWSEYWMTN